MTAVTTGRSRAWRTTWDQLRRDPLGLAGLVIVTSIGALILLAPWVAPYGPNEVDVYSRLLPPSASHWLGTDQLGRDIVSRLLFGGRIAMRVSLVAISTAMVIGAVMAPPKRLLRRDRQQRTG